MLRQSTVGPTVLVLLLLFFIVCYAGAIEFDTEVNINSTYFIYFHQTRITEYVYLCVVELILFALFGSKFEL